MNDNLSLTYYFGNNGVPIYPAPRFGSDVTSDDYLKAFPKNTLLVIGVHGFIKEKQEKYETYHDLCRIIDELQPLGLIIVGHLTSTLFDDLKAKTPFYFYDAFIEERSKEVNKHGN